MTRLARATAKALLAAGALILYSNMAAHSQPRPVTVEELTQESEVVAVGKVKDLASEWDETGTRIRTRVLLSVDQFVKGGEQGNTLSLYVPGGEIGTVGELYTHMPTFKREEQVIVFVRKDKQNRYRVSAGQAGKFTIERDKLSGRSTIPGQATLEQFTRQVRSTVERQESDTPPGN